MFCNILSLSLASITSAAVVTHPKDAWVPANANVKRNTIGPIATDSPAGITGGLVANSAPPVSSFFVGLNPPFPTNTWWASYAAPPGNETAAGPFPFESALYGDGLVFGISTNRQFDGTSIKQPTQTDWRATFVEHSGNFANHKATAFDEQSVTVQYFQGSSTMTSYLVPGSPYITLDYNGATPLLTSMNGQINAVNGQTVPSTGSLSVSGTEFEVTDSAGSTYLIYAFNSMTFTVNAQTLTATQAYTGVIRMAMLAEAAHKTLLDQYYSVYPTSFSLDYNYPSATEANLIFNWATVGSGSDLLMLTWPHHRLVLQNPNSPPTSSLSYLTTKGYMYPILGDQWTMFYNLNTITWDAPRAVDSSCEKYLIQGLEYEIGQLVPSQAPVPGDFYYWGGALAATARLALIADNLGRDDLVNPVIDYLEASFEFWFNGSSTVHPAYETTWGGVIDGAGANNVNVDFGNGFYNDHHFHYGYFLSIAAIIAKFDDNWLNQHRDYINWFARDIIDPSSQDPYFPITRCRDWFAGHSWASGIANGAGSRDQESTGEATNGYYGALLWASVALSQDFVNYANLLLTTEQQGAQVYWHLYPEQSPTDPGNPYPEAAVRELITMGNVEDWQAGAWLFWGAQTVEIAAIQMLPITPDKETLYDTQWVENVWQYTFPELTNEEYSDDWRCVIVAAYANANPQVAAEWSANISTWGSGNTYSNELYFIGTRPNPSGSPICGNMPSNPYGNFTLQAYPSGQYVSASASNTNLVANAGQSGAAAFTSAYLPNAGTLQLISTGQFVTADDSGNYDLAATRATASTWEQYVIRPKVGAPSGVYSIQASSNGQWVVVQSNGGLANNGTTESSSTGFYFNAA